MKLPSSMQIAMQLIQDNPKLFDCSINTKWDIASKISDAMIEYYDQCKAYVNQDQSKINEIKEQLKTLNNL